MQGMAFMSMRITQSIDLSKVKLVEIIRMRTQLVVLTLFSFFGAVAQNPIIPDKGVNDPHIRIFNGKAYLAASHDRASDNGTFLMDDWWLWSSTDLITWQLESVLKPEDTYIRKKFSSCWATDIAYRNGKYYWYFSEGNEQTGVVMADSPEGPWTDPLGKPLLTSEMTPTHEYDIGLVQDAAGDYYIVFGVWDYYIAKLNEDMISLAEEPRKIEVNNPMGPYNLDGLNKEKPTDDKPYMHYHNGKFYLSWGVFYAVSDYVYGPFEYKGTVMDSTSFRNGLESPTWPHGPLQGRHGSFFEWKNQTYFAYCDISQTGNRYFRDTFISYIHYKDNGDIEKIRVDLIGAGQYDAGSKIEAEEYFQASGITKKERTTGGFLISDIEEGDYVIYPNIQGVNDKERIRITLMARKKCAIEIRENFPDGQLLGKIEVKKGGKEVDQLIEFGSNNICLVFRGSGANLLDVDSFVLE